MKKLFLTSGVILCMACPAIAATDIPANGSGATCTYTYLGSYTGPVNYEAKWTAQCYNVTYTKGSGTNSACASSRTTAATGSMSSQSVCYDGSVTLTTPTGFTAPRGYTFGGYTGAKSDGTSGTQTYQPGDTVNPYKIAGNLALTAKWTPISSTITYAKGTASHGSKTSTVSGTMSNQSVAFDGCVTLTNNAYSATGFHFKEWRGNYSNADGSSTPYTAGSSTNVGTAYSNGQNLAPYNITNNMTLTAIWEANSHTVTFACSAKPSGASTNVANSSSVPSSMTATYGDDFTFPTLTSSQCKLPGYTAKWSCSSLGSTKYTQGQTLTPWAYTGTNGGTVACVVDWTANSYTITYNPGNAKPGTTLRTASGTAKTVSKTFDSAAGNALSNTATDLGTAFSLTGYSFAGWKATHNINSGSATAFTTNYYAGGTDYAAGTDLGTYHVQGNVNMYAQWTPNSYNVVYNGGGNCSNGNSNNGAYTHTNGATYDSNYTLLSASSSANPKIYAPTGWVFDGWSTNSTISYNGDTLQNKATNQTPWTKTSTWNLYSACTPAISGAITLDSKVYAAATGTTVKHNVGTEAGSTAAATSPLYSVYGIGMYTTRPTKQNYSSAQAYASLGTPPVCVGYNFGGFYTQQQAPTGTASGTKVINADGSWVTNVTNKQVTSDNTTKTWYAKWTPKTYTVTYNCGTGSRKSGAATSYTATFDASYSLASVDTICQKSGWHVLTTGTNNISGWVCRVGSTTTYLGATSGTWTFDNDYTCTAQWEANTVTPITYYRNYSSSDTTTVSGTGTGSCTYDGSITLPSNPSRTGYTFDGWHVRSGS